MSIALIATTEGLAVMNSKIIEDIIDCSEGAVRYSLLACYVALEYQREKKKNPGISEIMLLTGLTDRSWVDKCLQVIGKLSEKKQKDPLEQAIMEIFLKYKGDAHFNYKVEVPAVKRLADLMSSYEDRIIAAQRICETFYKLVNGKDKFWKSQPFLPSVLSSSGIFPRVTNEVGKADKESNIVSFPSII